MLKWRHNLSASTHLISFPLYKKKDIDGRLYNLKNTFKYQPRNDTPFIEVIQDSIQIERDFKEAAKEQRRLDARAKAAQAMANRNKRRR